MAVGMKNYYIAKNAVDDAETIAKYLYERQLKTTEESFEKCGEIQNIIKGFCFLTARGNRVLCSGSNDENSVRKFVGGHLKTYNQELDKLEREHQTILAFKKDLDKKTSEYNGLTRKLENQTDNELRELKELKKSCCDMRNLVKTYKVHLNNFTKMRQNITIDFRNFDQGEIYASFSNEPYITMFKVLCNMKTIRVKKLIARPGDPPELPKITLYDGTQLE